jgi:hypothetical protein
MRTQGCVRIDDANVIGLCLSSTFGAVGDARAPSSASGLWRGDFERVVVMTPTAVEICRCLFQDVGGRFTIPGICRSEERGRSFVKGADAAEASCAKEWLWR